MVLAKVWIPFINVTQKGSNWEVTTVRDLRTKSAVTKRMSGWMKADKYAIW